MQENNLEIEDEDKEIVRMKLIRELDEEYSKLVKFWKENNFQK